MQDIPQTQSHIETQNQQDNEIIEFNNQNRQRYLQYVSRRTKIIFASLVVTVILIIILVVSIPTNKITVIFMTCCQNHHTLALTVSSFIHYNEAPIEKVIIVNDGKLNFELISMINKFSNLSLMATGKKIGHVKALDEALLLVETPYVYISEDDWQTLQKGLIIENINALQKQPLLLQLRNRNHEQQLLNKQLVKTSQKWGGLSFPSVLRRKDITRLNEGKLYNNLNQTYDESNYQNIYSHNIINYFQDMGYYVKKAQKQYFRYLSPKGQNQSHT